MSCRRYNNHRQTTSQSATDKFHAAAWAATAMAGPAEAARESHHLDKAPIDHLRLVIQVKTTKQIYHFMKQTYHL
jgi:hypothetical protein